MTTSLTIAKNRPVVMGQRQERNFFLSSKTGTNGNEKYSEIAKSTFYVKLEELLTFSGCAAAVILLLIGLITVVVYISKLF